MRKAQKLIQKLNGRYHCLSFWRLCCLGERALPDLLATLKSTNPATRKAAVLILGSIQGPRAIAGIESCLWDPDEEVLIAASHELREAGMSAERIWSLLESESVDVRSSACGSLGAMKFVAALPDILRLLDDPSIWVSSSALYSIGDLGSSELFDLVKSKITAEDYRERGAALHALRDLDETAALPTVIAALYDTEMYVRMPALVWFEEHPNEQARPALEYVRENDYQRQATTAAKILETLNAQQMSVTSQPENSQAFETLPTQHPTAYVHLQERERQLTELKRSFRRQKSFTADQLGFLAECLTNYDNHVKTESASMLRDMKSPEAQEILFGCLTDPDPDVRSIAISAFEGTERSSNQTALKAMKSDPNDRVRSSAIRALARLTYPEGLQDLIEHSRDGFSVFRYFTAHALGNFGDDLAIERLQEMTTDRSMLVRSSAATALGLVGNSNSLPYLMRLRGNDFRDVESAAKRAIQKINQRMRDAESGI